MNQAVVGGNLCFPTCMPLLPPLAAQSCEVQETFRGRIVVCEPGAHPRLQGKLLPLGLSGLEAAKELLHGSISLADAIRQSFRARRQQVRAFECARVRMC